MSEINQDIKEKIRKIFFEYFAVEPLIASDLNESFNISWDELKTIDNGNCFSIFQSTN